ncbi:MAG: ABC transporter permease [Clostridia bacterium]|nr:ABC transporter permease [Clostridia bacterium]MBQ4156734.1 ABC transporter permease [Clostridia bacterium]
MRMKAFSVRCLKEIVRDPLNLFFGLAFPLILLCLLSAIQANIPVNLFEIERLAPGITVFGLSFMTLFSATLVARDRETSFMDRLFTTPLTAFDFISGYILSLFPVALLQGVISYLAALAFGLKLSVNILFALIALFPIALFFISLGLLLGSVLTVKQAGGVAGALVTNLSAWLSGIWFDLELVGGTFQKIADLFPFVHAVNMERAIINGSFQISSGDIFYVTAWAIAVFLIAVLLFVRQMRK